MKCYKDTNESDSDEPYALVFAAQLNNQFGVKIPAAHTVLYGPWGQVDSGDTVRTGQLFYGPGGTPLVPAEDFWGLSGKPEDLNNDDDAILLVALMENDNGKPAGIRAGLHAQLFAAITSYANSKMAREDMIRELLRDMRDALKGPISIGILNNDDLVGVGELRVNIQSQRSNSQISSLHLNGDGGKYELFFETLKH